MLCFQLALTDKDRQTSTRPTNESTHHPLTELSMSASSCSHKNLNIVRLLAAGTIEEALVRLGGSLAYLQGMKIREVNFFHHNGNL